MAYQPQTQEPRDYFDDFEKVPSLSWATAPVGTVVKGTISRLPREVQDSEIGTRTPKFWKSGEPQMSVVLNIDIVTTAGEPETRSVWAKKPSSLYRALGQAQKDAGAKFALGGTLYIRLERLEPSKTPGFNPQKIYAAKYEPPVAVDPWAGAGQQPTYAQPAQTTQAPPAAQPANGTWPVATQPATQPAQPQPVTGTTPTW